jgi:hypothetical protein
MQNAAHLQQHHYLQQQQHHHPFRDAGTPLPVSTPGSFHEFQDQGGYFSSQQGGNGSGAGVGFGGSSSFGSYTPSNQAPILEALHSSTTYQHFTEQSQMYSANVGQPHSHNMHPYLDSELAGNNFQAESEDRRGSKVRV